MRTVVFAGREAPIHASMRTPIHEYAKICVCVSASHARLFRGLWVCVWPRGP